MTPEEHWERRKRIEDSLAQASAAYYTKDKREAQIELQRAKNLYAARVKEAATGILGVDLETPEEDLERAEKRLARIEQVASAAHQQRLVAEDNLRVCLAEGIDVFSIEAQKLSERAEKAVKIIMATNSISQAEAMWHEAQEAWRPLVGALNAQAAKHRGRATLEGVKPFPISVSLPVVASPNGLNVEAA